MGLVEGEGGPDDFAAEVGPAGAPGEGQGVDQEEAAAAFLVGGGVAAEWGLVFGVPDFDEEFVGQVVQAEADDFEAVVEVRVAGLGRDGVGRLMALVSSSVTTRPASSEIVVRCQRSSMSRVCMRAVATDAGMAGRARQLRKRS